MVKIQMDADDGGKEQKLESARRFCDMMEEEVPLYICS